MRGSAFHDLLFCITGYPLYSKAGRRPALSQLKAQYCQLRQETVGKNIQDKGDYVGSETYARGRITRGGGVGRRKNR